MLRQAEAGVSVIDLRREYGMINALFYKLQAKYEGIDTSMIAQMMTVEV